MTTTPEKSSDAFDGYLDETSNDITPLEAAMRRWGRVYRTSVTPQMIEDYRQELKGMHPADFDRAVQHLRKTSKFFPRPSEIWQAARTEGWL